MCGATETTPLQPPLQEFRFVLYVPYENGFTEALFVPQCAGTYRAYDASVLLKPGIAWSHDFENFKDLGLCLIARPYFTSFRKTTPPFITNFTRSISVMSVSGSPETATKSANLPFSTVPRFLPKSKFKDSAALVVAMRRASTGFMPHFTNHANCDACMPCPWK